MAGKYIGEYFWQADKMHWLKLEAAFWLLAKKQSIIRNYAFWIIDQKH